MTYPSKHKVFETTLFTVVVVTSLYNFFEKGEYSVNVTIASLSALLGVICVIYGAKGSMANWIVGIVECFLHIYITCVEHFYGDALQRLFYNLPMQFIGWNSWKKRRVARANGKKRLRTRFMTWRVRLITLLVIAISTVLLSLFLKYHGSDLREFLVAFLANFNIEADFKTLKPDYPSQLSLWLDSFTTVCSIIAMYISVKAYVEMWWIWLAINVAYLIMWGSNPNSDFTFMTIVKYSIYLVNTFYGLYMWNRLSKSSSL